jgi:hypothetical protein
MTLVKSFGKAPALVAWPAGQEGKEQCRRVVLRYGMKEIDLNLRKIIEAIIENLTKLAEERRPRNLRSRPLVQLGIGVNRFELAKSEQSLQQDQDVRAVLMGATTDLTFAESLQAELRIDPGVAQVPESLPERCASAEPFFDPCESFGACLTRPNKPAHDFLEKQIVAQFGRMATPFSAKTRRQLEESQQMDVEQGQTPLTAQNHFKVTPQ